MTDLSREELRAHLSAVEAQVRAALRIVAAESKSVQQAHSALRADLSAALIRLQSEMNSGSGKLDNKLDRVLSDVGNLGRQRKLTTAILTTLVLLFGITVGVLAGGSWYFLNKTESSASISLPFLGAEDMRGQSSATQPSMQSGMTSQASQGQGQQQGTQARNQGAPSSGQAQAGQQGQPGMQTQTGAQNQTGAQSAGSSSGSSSSADMSGNASSTAAPPDQEPSVRILTAQ